MSVSRELLNSFKVGVFIITLVLPIFGGNTRTVSSARANSTPSNLESLANGNYQFCSKPEPDDGRDGDGVCFVFAKLGDRVDGYYGYPHSEVYVCVRGRVEGNQVSGYGLFLAWSSVLTSEYTWRLDQYLTLQNGYVVQSRKGEHEELSWVQYDDLKLNIGDFYQYPTVKMHFSPQMCEWEVS
ncbi:hypothetical protein [Acaryochloris sp. CCMEE 5410]|uniref:hypothetical protein n=1 Tax=Acaryochloris sp. CCMEE 5410 TaxID=310037 RepID=UPI0002483F6A|nr:hypothetical protein [Acaryochloris sp. CCMEE 5410]KAI9134410.1 hypothetical protein ON05_014735 [Acaryochloris sp. CCMEE 5410]